MESTSANRMKESQTRLLELWQFLVDWKWLSLSRPTLILVDNVLDSNAEIIRQMSSLTIEEHLAVLSGDLKATLPPLIKNFVEASARLELNSDVKLDKHEIHTAPQKNTSAKKHHETARLSKIVSSICSSKSLKCIIDIGSGLGYVDRELCKVLEDCDVLAIESEEARCTSADAVNRMFGFGERIKQLPLKLQGSNVKEVADDLCRAINGPGCLIALHACGDLTPAALRLFERMSLMDSAVILSCCYHKMSKNGPSGFLNFPMSSCLKNMLSSGSVDPSLADVSFLRLAAESTKEMWAVRGVRQLSLHARSVAYRALVVSYEHKEGIRFYKKVRKPAKASSRNSWTAYVDAWVANTDATRLSDGKIVEKEVIKAELEGLCSETAVEELVSKTLAFNTLKSCIQHTTELLVLEDRLLALTEAGYPKCNLVRVSDPSVSPRSIAIVVSR